MTEPFETQQPFGGVDPNAGRSDERLRRVTALAEMHATPRSARKALGLPLTDKAFADHWGVVPNRISKDKQSDLYKRLLEEAKERQARQIDPRGSAALTEERIVKAANDDFSVYERLKGQLADDAMSGDLKALDLWLRLWGTPFIQEEVNRVDVVSGLDDRALVTEIVDLVDHAMLVDILKERGVL